MTDLVWLHEDALRADHPVFERCPPDTRALFIWDDVYLQRMDYGFKRLLFIYETLIDLPCDILRGDMHQCLLGQVRQNGGGLLVPATPNPVLGSLIDRLQTEIALEVIDDVPFVSLAEPPDLKRFFRYWKQARKSAFLPDGRGEGGV